MARAIVVAAVLAGALLAGCGGSPSKRGSRHPAAIASRPLPTRVVGGAAAGAAIDRLIHAGRPVYCGGDRPYAALTFDDGPGVYTRLALRILRKAHAPGTFFLVGRNLARFHGLARADAHAGALGNHTWTHPMLPSLPSGAIESEIARTSAGIRAAAGVAPRLFRPPYEARNATVDSSATRNRLLEILWNVDSHDSEGANYAQIAHHVLTGISPGAIVLMHENRGQTIRALKFNILPALRRRHIRLVTVPQLLALDPPTPRELAQGRKGCRYHAPVSAGA
ncbi:MAG: polysaccharide deacetylase family protein [Gaiellaceae bacterium]